MRGFSKGIILVSIVAIWALGYVAWRNLACGCSTRESAYQAAMKSDLRNLVTAQDTFFEQQGRFGTNLDSLGFVPSPGVRLEVLEATREGFLAVATHTAIYGHCEIYQGKVSQPPAIGDQIPAESNPVCTPRQKRYRKLP